MPDSTESERASEGPGVPGVRTNSELLARGEGAGVTQTLPWESRSRRSYSSSSLRDARTFYKTSRGRC